MNPQEAPAAAAAILAAVKTPDRYIGFRSSSRCVLYADKREVPPGRSQAVRNHSPDGFAWGYGGSGPAQLALALLLDAGLPEFVAVRLYQIFKWAFVARWPQEANWYLTGADLRRWLADRLAEWTSEDWMDYMEYKEDA